MSFKIGMVGLLSNPNPQSKLVEIERQLVEHLYAPCTILTEQDDWDEYNYLYILDKHKNRPMTEIVRRCEKLVDYVAFGKGTVVKSESLVDYEPDDIITNLPNPLPRIGNISALPLNPDLQIVGDGHAPSIWPGPNYGLVILPLKTLADFLRKPIKADWYYLGNVDVRHYLALEQNPIQATIDLATQYIELARGYKAKVTCLLPIESERRVIAKEFMHNNKTFHGDRELRARLVEEFNKCLLQSGLEVHQWPKWWYEKPYLYETTVMEQKPTPYVK